MTAVVSTGKAVSGGVAVPTAVDAGLASWPTPQDRLSSSRLFGVLQLTVGGGLFLAGGWGMGRRLRER